VAGVFADSEEVLDFLKQKNQEVHPIIMDIEINGRLNGIQLAREINQRESIQIIFLTKKDDDKSIVDASLSGYVSYLTKPINNPMLKAALINCMKTRSNPFEPLDLENALTDAVFVRNGLGQYKVLIADVLYLEASHETTKLYTSNTDNPLVVSGNLSKILDKLSFTNQFVRTSRFNAVNLKKVESVNIELKTRTDKKEKGKKYIKMYGVEEFIPLSEKYRGDVMDRLNFL
jgi:DNA-binding LytR/AlgR family response regulator